RNSTSVRSFSKWLMQGRFRQHGSQRGSWVELVNALERIARSLILAKGMIGICHRNGRTLGRRAKLHRDSEPTCAVIARHFVGQDAKKGLFSGIVTFVGANVGEKILAGYFSPYAPLKKSVTAPNGDPDHAAQKIT